MNDLCAEIGYKSINHYGEELCGDHVDVVEQEDETSTVIVLADGLGSGVKASILSTLTSKIISTMMAAGLELEECVKTIAATLPVCSVRGVAYSTFTIIHLIDQSVAEIIQYDNPQVIVLRDGKNYEYPRTEMTIDGKKIYKSRINLCENDVRVAYIIDTADDAFLSGIKNRYVICIAEAMLYFLCNNSCVAVNENLILDTGLVIIIAETVYIGRRADYGA